MALFVLLAGAYLFLVYISLYSCSAGPIDFFDGALYLLQTLYTSRGLIPYRDFGFVYPPGTALLFGHLLHLQSTTAINATAGVFIALATGINVWLIARLSESRHRQLINCGAFLAFSGITVLLWLDLGVEPFTPFLCMAALLLTAQLVKENSTHARGMRVGLFVVAFLLMFFRWDRLPAMLLVDTGLLIFAIGLTFWERRHPCSAQLRQAAIQLASVITYKGAGGALAVVTMSAYTLAMGTLRNAVSFVFQLPFAIMPYRKLPIPFSWRLWNIDTLWLNCTLSLLIVWVIFVASWLTQRRQGNGTQAPSFFFASVVLSGPFFLLPYALGRADWVHATGLVLLSGAAVLVTTPRLQSTVLRLICYIALMLPLAPVSHYLRQIPPLFSPSACGRQTKEIQAHIDDCRRLVPQDARSLFVGRTRYDLFIINRVVLYFASDTAVPASLFISDEPGLQNTCQYGERIAQDLAAAPRPLVALLEIKPHHPEPNATQHMTSCGKIEEFLHQQRHEVVGSCKSGGVDFEVWLYLSL